MSGLNMWHLFAAARRRRAEQWRSPDQLAQGRAHRLQRLSRAAEKTPHYRLTEPADRLFPVTTSGSTGQPVRVRRSQRDQAKYRHYFTSF